MPPLPLDDAASLYTALEDFFQVVVHSVLFHRRLYPERSFLSATAFDVPVHQNRHPQVCAWVRDAVGHVMEQVAGGGVDVLGVVVHAPFTRDEYDSQGAPPLDLPPGAVLERWMFDVRGVPGWPGGADALHKFRRQQQKGKGRAARSGRARNRNRSPQKQGDGDPDHYDYYDEDEEYANAESEADLGKAASPEPEGEEPEPSGPAGDGALNWFDLQHQLRAVVQRLAYAGDELAPLPAGCTFTMAVELREDGEQEGAGGENPSKLLVETDPNWVPSERRGQLDRGGARPAKGRRNPATTTTIRSVDVSPLYMECWVEESTLKPKPGDDKQLEKGKEKTAEEAVVGDSQQDYDEDVLPPPPPPPPELPEPSIPPRRTHLHSTVEDSPEESRRKSVSFRDDDVF